MTDATFTLAELSAILAKLDFTLGAKEASWRIKAWQRMGYLPHVGRGKGTRAIYSLEYVWKCCLLAKFQSMGVIPVNANDFLASQPVPPLSVGLVGFARDNRGSSITIALTHITQAISGLIAERRE